MPKTNFVDGDPSQGILGTVVPADFLNALNNHYHTGLDQDGHGALPYAADTGTVNTYIVTLAPALTQYVEGMPLYFKAANANTGPSTINVNGLGTIAIKKNNGSDLSDGDIEAGQIVECFYDGTVFQIAATKSYIELAITETGDFSGGPENIVHVVFPWASPAKLADPSTAPTGFSYGVAWSPNGEFLAIAHEGSPYVTIYQRTGKNFTKLANPTTLPTGACQNATWSLSGEFLAIAQFTSPYIAIYQRSGTTFTKLANPAALPAGYGFGSAWSPNGQFLAVAHDVAPYVTLYERSGRHSRSLRTLPCFLPGRPTVRLGRQMENF